MTGMHTTLVLLIRSSQHRILHENLDTPRYLQGWAIPEEVTLCLGIAMAYTLVREQRHLAGRHETFRDVELVLVLGGESHLAHNPQVGSQHGRPLLRRRLRVAI